MVMLRALGAGVNAEPARVGVGSIEYPRRPDARRSI